MTTLDYRTPETGTHRVQRVISQLENAEALSWAGIASRIFFGIPLCLLGPLLATGLVSSILHLFSSGTMSSSSVFLIMCAVATPLLFWLERRTAGEYGSELLRGTSSPSSYGEFEMIHMKAWWVFWMEVALIGPRLILSATDCLRGQTRGDPETRAVAAAILVRLLDEDQGVVMRDLIGADSSAADVVRAVAFLETHDWVDLSGKRDRVWLTSRARNSLIWMQSAAERGNVTGQL